VWGHGEIRPFCGDGYMQESVESPHLDLPVEALPRHVAIIMDGNGRWARARGKGRTFGHRCGAEALRPIVIECAQLGLEALTLYSFSTENWARSDAEVRALMDLYVEYLISERDLFYENNVRFLHIGRREGLPGPVLDELDRMTESTHEHSGLTMLLALNYGSRGEITDAVRSIVRDAHAGQLKLEAINEAMISSRLYTAGLPDPDLLIRTAGEMRLSNYLLWQISYAEFYIDEALWPDFDVTHLHEALRCYSQRCRRFGAIGEP